MCSEPTQVSGGALLRCSAASALLATTAVLGLGLLPGQGRRRADAGHGFPRGPFHRGHGRRVDGAEPPGPGTAFRGQTQGSAPGGCYGLAQIVQTFGPEHTSASSPGFLTGLCVVMTPVSGLVLLRHPTPPTTGAAVALATVGLGVIALGGTALGGGANCSPCSERPATPCTSWDWVRGPRAGRPWVWRPGSCRPSPRSRPPGTLPGGIVPGRIVPGRIVPPPDGEAWLSVLYTGLLAGGVALLRRTWAQSVPPATHPAIIMAGEPVFAVFFAIVRGQEELATRTVLGRVPSGSWRCSWSKPPPGTGPVVPATAGAARSSQGFRGSRGFRWQPTVSVVGSDGQFESDRHEGASIRERRPGGVRVVAGETTGAGRPGRDAEATTTRPGASRSPRTGAVSCRSLRI
jgi:drug/metabolite transporter (DMT)-like permease